MVKRKINKLYENEIVSISGHKFRKLSTGQLDARNNTHYQNENYYGIKLKNALFNANYLSKANFISSKLDNVKFDAEIEYDNINQCAFEKNTILDGANFTNANLKNVIFNGANLTEANFTGANLTEANFTGANLTGANFTGATLKDVKFFEADLTGANFTNATIIINECMPREIFEDTNLTDANFTGVTIKTYKSYKNNIFTNAILTNVNLFDVKSSNPIILETIKKISDQNQN
jgi:uncharacterized protein YjbI with pentapeptide repeats